MSLLKLVADNSRDVIYTQQEITFFKTNDDYVNELKILMDNLHYDNNTLIFNDNICTLKNIMELINILKFQNVDLSAIIPTKFQDFLDNHTITI